MTIFIQIYILFKKTFFRAYLGQKIHALFHHKRFLFYS